MVVGEAVAPDNHALRETQRRQEPPWSQVVLLPRFGGSQAYYPPFDKSNMHLDSMLNARSRFTL